MTRPDPQHGFTAPVMAGTDTERCLNVLVLHWQDPAALERCLASVLASERVRLRVILIDNGSTPEARAGVIACAERYLAAGVDLHLVLNAENLGYAGGNNTGLNYLQDARLGGDLCVLNPDVTVQTDTLHTLLHTLTADIGLAMCRTCSPSGAVLYDAVKLTGYRQHFFQSELSITETDYAQGACFVIRRDVAEQGLFDERFFLYWEEVELALRARLAGHRVVSTSATTILRSANSPARLPNALYYSVRNARLLLQKYPKFFTKSGYVLYAMRLALLLIKLLPKPRLLLQGAVYLIRGVQDGADGRFGKRADSVQHLVTPRAQIAEAAAQQTTQEGTL